MMMKRFDNKFKLARSNIGVKAWEINVTSKPEEHEEA